MVHIESRWANSTSLVSEGVNSSWLHSCRVALSRLNYSCFESSRAGSIWFLSGGIESARLLSFRIRSSRLDLVHLGLIQLVSFRLESIRAALVHVKRSRVQ